MEREDEKKDKAKCNRSMVNFFLSTHHGNFSSWEKYTNKHLLKAAQV